MADADTQSLEEPASVEPEGRRQQRKNHTRRALQEAALELFAEKGFDDTTTEEVASKAGVSARTFFRYFPTKESVLFAGQFQWFQSLAKRFLASSDVLSDIEALHHTLVSHAPRLVSSRSSFELYQRAIASSPVLRGCVHDNMLEDILQLSDAIAERRGLAAPDESCRVLAQTALMLYRRALTLWAEQPATRQPSRLITEQFELLISQIPATTDLRSRTAPS